MVKKEKRINFFFFKSKKFVCKFFVFFVLFWVYGSCLIFNNLKESKILG